LIRRCAAVVALAVLPLACSGKPPEEAPGAGPPASPAPTPDLERPLSDPLPAVAARVNGQPIPIAGVHKLAKKGTGTVSFAYRQALEELIDRELLFEEALVRRLSADDAAVQRSYDEARVSHPDDAEWARFLKDEFLDPQSFRTELRARFTIEALVRSEGEKVPPASDLEARRYYDSNPSTFETGERIEARQIFFRVPTAGKVSERDAIRAQAEAVLARIRKGEDFAALARQVSQDRDSAAEGGKLPPFARGQAALPLELAAFAMQPGELSDVVWTVEGFHILRVDGRLPSVKLPFEAVEEKIKLSLRTERQQRRIRELVASLRAKARIERYL